MSAQWGLIQDDPEGVGTWVCDRVGGIWYEGAGTAIGFTFEGKMAGGITYTQWNGASVTLSFALEDHRFINRAALWAAFWYPLVQLGAKRVTALVDCDNVRSLAFVEHLGFIREATLRDASPNGDQIVFRMLKSECRWLKDLRYKPKERPLAAA